VILQGGNFERGLKKMAIAGIIMGYVEPHELVEWTDWPIFYYNAPNPLDSIPSNNTDESGIHGTCRKGDKS